MKKLVIILGIVALIALVVVLAGAEMWFGGFHFGPPKVGPIPSASWVGVEATVDKDSYLVGEDIRIEFTFQNNSTEVFPIEPFPPKIMVMPSLKYGLIIREFPEGTGKKPLEPGEVASYTLTWDQRDKHGQQVPAACYKVALGNINSWEQKFMLTLLASGRLAEMAMPWQRGSAPHQLIKLMPRYDVVPVNTVESQDSIGPIKVRESMVLEEFKAPIMVGC
ncbi:MAG TPA: hypothetical protein VMW37_05270 [Dehalococcoidales bacterium]|nr:hypothetical protein [Dehalococcoidales bacterium]